jgi:lipid II:glycine glycyltransferase (peptidoglycan interpeptide bridge formation enzyme)
VRNEVSKATKNGIVVEKGSKSDIELLFKLLDIRNRIHTDVTFLPDIFENFYPDNLNFFIAKKDGIPLTGAINILYKNKICGWVGLPKVSVDGINPNYLLVWECIRWACQNGLEIFENISANELSTFHFKNKFNSEIVPCYRVKWYSPVPHFLKSIYLGFRHETY